ncbi:hypothetical protein E4T43_06892 [Aureobasidium subglaciale]|nr:hypothetical protein E4T43_06892 [Aureobasidium subglaciale]
MYYTAEELATDPVPVPDSPTWSSERAYYDERALLLERLAETLYPSTDDICTNSDDDSISFSVSDSDPDSDTSTVIASTCDRTPSRASTFFTSAFASASFISVLSSSPSTSLTFRSPQTSTFSFQNSAGKTDSVMGSPSRFSSPIKFSSPSIFKRKNKEAKIVEEEEEGVKIEEGDIFQYLKSATEEKNDGGEKRLSGSSSIGSSKRSSTTSKNSVNSSSTTVDISGTNHTRVVDTSNANHPAFPNFMTSPRTKTPGSPLTELATQFDMDLEAKQYVIERLGRFTVGEPQSISHQHNFVMAQLEKTKQLALEAEGSSDDEDEEMVVKSADDILMKW